MSVKAITWAFNQPISGNGKVVLLALADHADDDGKCWPSIPLVAKKARISERTVQRMLVVLESDGLVKRVHQTGNDGRNAANLYLLSVDGVNVSPVDGDSSVTGDGDSSVTGDGDKCVTTLKRTTNKNHQKEPSDILPGSDLKAEFDEFWAAYPKRPGNPKSKAKEKYLILRKQKVSHETLVNAARKYAELRKGEDPKFTAWAVTWLNQWRFEDDFTVDGGTTGTESAASEKDLKELAAVFPGHIGNPIEAAKLIAAEISSGTTLADLINAAIKYKLYCKGPPYEDRRIPPAMMETWLKFKWREMDAYEISFVGPDRIKTVKLKKVKS